MLLFYIFISALSLRWERWIIPLLPFASIIIAYTLNQIGEWLKKWLKMSIVFWLILIYLGAITIPLAEINRVEFRELTGPDTRTVAREWILTNIPSQSSILVDEGPPPLSSRTYNLYEVKKGSLRPIKHEQTRHDFVGPDIDSLGNLKNVKQIQDYKIEYIILSWKYLKYLEEAHNYPEKIQTYQHIIADAKLIHEVKREGEINSGPTVQIYQIQQKTPL